MQRKILKPIALILTLVLCLCLFPACQKNDPLAQNGITSILFEKNKKRAVATVTLDARTLEAHTGEVASLYELLPGENTADLAGREPIAVSGVKGTMTFGFPLETQEHTRLYSTFVVGFEDGSFLSVNGKRIENPQALADNTQSFLWSASPKGLVSDNVDHAAALGAMHTMLELSLTDLSDGSDSFRFGTVDYTYRADTVAALDRSVLSATNAGLQVSLKLQLDCTLSVAHVTALLDLLTSRYAGGERGLVSAIFLEVDKDTSPADAAELCRVANQALRFRVANGRVYIVSNADTLTDAQVFFSDVQHALALSGAPEWGAAVKPQIDLAAIGTDTENADLLTPQKLALLSSYLFSSPANGRASYFAVTDLALSAEDEDVQAASLAYTYRACVAAKAGLIFYASHMNDAYGLCSSAGVERRAADVFATVDTGLSSDDQLLCSTLLGDAWTSLPATKETRRVSVGAAVLGTGGFAEIPLFDFTTAETYGFTGVESATQPISRNSAYFRCPVLYTWLKPSQSTAAGIRKTMENGAALDRAMSISVNLLTQAPNATACTARLRLDGYATDGTLLTHLSELAIENGSWQTVTFQISEFVAAADLSAPCTLTLTVEPDETVDEEYVLWVRYMDVRAPQQGIDRVFSIALIVGGVLIGFLGVFIIYHKTGNKRRKK